MKRELYQQIPRFLTGLAAASLLVWLMVSRIDGNQAPLILLASIFLLLFCATDTLRTKIPNPLTLTLAVTGAGFQLLVAGPTGLLAAVLGLLTGFILLIGPYALGGMGGGDVKALAALGALLGPADIFQVFLYMGLMGGVLAILHYLLETNLRERAQAWWLALKTLACTRDPHAIIPTRTEEKLRFPYAAAIAFGFVAFQHWGSLL